MIYRAFRHAPTGLWLNTLMTSEDGFRQSPEQHGLDVLTGYRSQGWDPDDLEVVDSDADPRKGVLIEPDPPVVDPCAERLESLHALLAAQDLTGPQTSEMLRLERNL